MIAAVKRDLEEFARSYEESHEDESDSVFMRADQREPVAGAG